MDFCMESGISSMIEIRCIQASQDSSEFSYDEILREFEASNDTNDKQRMGILWSIHFVYNGLPMYDYGLCRDRTRSSSSIRGCVESDKHTIPALSMASRL